MFSLDILRGSVEHEVMHHGPEQYLAYLLVPPAAAEDAAVSACRATAKADFVVGHVVVLMPG